MRQDLSKLGHHFIVGLAGTKLADKEKELLRLLQPAGIIIFAHNIAKNDSNWHVELKSLIEQAKTSSGREQFFVSIDHEGGKVHRLPSPITHFPAAQKYANEPSEVAGAMARELRALSFNLSFAPVLDIHSEPQNPVIGERAFGETPEKVSAEGLRFVSALEAEGVLSCAKHFPGHGATKTDSHLELPVLHSSLELLEKRELLPFRSFIKAGHRLIMTAHVLYPALDRTWPATLSRSILTGLLRKELGFTDTIISDDLEMKALAKIPLHERGIRALQAGVDILLVANPEKTPGVVNAMEMAKGIMRSIEEGSLAEDHLDASEKRILGLLKYSGEISAKAPKALSLDEIDFEKHAKLQSKLSLA